MTKEICMFLLVHHLTRVKCLTEYLNRQGRIHAPSWRNMREFGCLIPAKEIRQLETVNDLPQLSGALSRLHGIPLTRIFTLFNTAVMICTEHGPKNIPSGKVLYCLRKNF